TEENIIQKIENDIIESQEDEIKEDVDFTFHKIENNETCQQNKNREYITIALFLFFFFLLILLIFKTDNDSTFNYPNTIKLKRKIDTIATNVSTKEMTNYKLNSNFTFFEVFKLL